MDEEATSGTDVLGFGATEKIDEKANPFSPENLQEADTSQEEDAEENPFVIDEDDEVIDLRDTDTDRDTTGDEESDEEPDALTDDLDQAKLNDDALEAVIARYKGDPKALAKAVKEAQRKITEQGAELGTLRKAAKTPVEPEATQATTGDLGFPLDEFGLEKVPHSYFAGEFTRKVQEAFEEDPRVLEGYLVQAGYSQEKAREEAKYAFDNDLVGRHAAAYAEEAKALYQTKYQELRSAKSGEKNQVELSRMAELQKEQVRVCDTERKSRLADFEAMGATQERAKALVIDIHNSAIALVQADIKAGRLTALESHNPEIVPEYYDKALLMLSKQSGGLSKLIYKAEEANNSNNLAGVTSKTGGARVATKAGVTNANNSLGPEAKAFYETLKNSKPDLTIEQYKAKHGKTINMAK